MKKARQSKSQVVSQGLAIAALILNILILPGLGTLIAGRIKTGVIQLVIALISIPLMFLIIGIPIFLIVWIWGIVTAVNLIKEAK
ncbi:hypothetical protein HYZ97_00310 [Candidatus Pacearchaeota archaeon]|nr:hypothetical protein [Candidatus Pacearchaeota archaeon]